MGEEDTQDEGRIITLEYENFYLVNVYTPNAQRDLARLPLRLDWEDRLASYLQKLNSKKPVVYCGDLNVAHTEIDLKNAKSNIGNSGFTYEERAKFSELLASGFVDSFRYKHPDETDHYTWWSYMNKVRERNIGWRIDYFVVSDLLKNQIDIATIHPHIMGSDHCPIELQLHV